MVTALPAYLCEPRSPLRVLARREYELRDAPLGVSGRTTSAATDRSEERVRLLEEWARLLELALIFVSSREAVASLGLRTWADVARENHRVDALVRTISRLDPLRVIAENERDLATFMPDEPVSPSEPTGGDSAEVLRTIQSLLLHSPEEALVPPPGVDPLPELSHRCRLAIAGLRAFVARNLHPAGEAIAAVGRAYAEARLSVDEVAATLGMFVPDAVALLEEHGYRRSIERLRLTDEERRARVAAIREERLARKGEPLGDQRLVAREVVASQRIEDVDARPWLRP